MRADCASPPDARPGGRDVFRFAGTGKRQSPPNAASAMSTPRRPILWILIAFLLGWMTADQAIRSTEPVDSRGSGVSQNAER